MSDKLVKEIITTTTERFGDNGSIKEKVTESREKIYEYGYTDKQIAEAEVIDKTPKEEIESQGDLISQAAQNIDNTTQPQNPMEASVGVPKYTRVSSPTPMPLGQTQQPVSSPVPFPWEQQR